MGFNIDITIVVLFLSLNLIVGMYYGRGVKTMEDYALGGRRFSTGALVSTIVSTFATGSLFMIGISRIYTHGLYDLLPTLGVALSMLFSAYVFIPRMNSFLGSLSIAQSLGEYYCQKVRIITAICSIVANIGIISVQYKVFGGMVAYFLDIDPNITVIAAGIVVTLYSAFGGIRSVTFTDILQFMVFGVVIPLIGIVIWKSTLAIDNFSFTQTLQHPNFSFSKVLDYKTFEFWEIVALFIYFSIGSALHPAAFQRISIGRDIRQVKKAFTISAIILLAIIVAISWISFLILTIKPDLGSEQLVPYIVDHYTTTGFKGLIVVGIMAMAMSSADSFINVASVIFTHDFCKPLNIGSKNQLKLTRIFALLLGFGSIILAVSAKDLLGVILFANAFYVPIVTMPLLLTILGLRTTSKSTLTGMFAGFLTVIIWKILDIDFDPIVPAMFCNLIFMLGTHYLLKQPGCWIDTKIVESKIEKTSLLTSLKEFNFMDFIKINTPKNDNIYSFFGVFCFISTISTIYLTHNQLLGSYSDLLLFIYQIMLVISCFFMLYVMWSPKIKHPIAVGIFWNIALLYMLSFCSSLFLLLSGYDQIQLLVFTMNLMVLFNLCRWKIALIILVSGFSFGIVVYKSVLDGKFMDVQLEQNYLALIYITLLCSTALITFLKPKQEYLEITENKVGELGAEVGTLKTQTKVLEKDVFNFAHENYSLANKVRKMDYELEERSIRAQRQEHEIQRLGATAEKILNNVNHELRLPIGNVMNFATMLRDGLEKYDKERLKELTDEVYKNSTRLSSMILNMLDLATLNVQKVDLRKTLVNLSEIVLDRVGTCCRVYLEDKPINFELSVQEEVMISVDPNYMRQTIDNLLINAIKFSEKGSIKISLTEKDGKINFTIIDQGKGIPQGELADIFQAFKIGSNNESKASGRGVGLALCKAVIEAHGGEIKAESNGISSGGAKFWFELDK